MCVWRQKEKTTLYRRREELACNNSFTPKYRRTDFAKGQEGGYLGDKQILTASERTGQSTSISRHHRDYVVQAMFEGFLDHQQTRNEVHVEMNAPGRIQQNLVDDIAAAEMLGIKPPTMRSWCCRGVGPAYVKLGTGRNAAVRYDLRDLAQFIEQGRHASSSVRAASED
jgi:hypothetical protein